LAHTKRITPMNLPPTIDGECTVTHLPHSN
jgi:hypothetical protein